MAAGTGGTYGNAVKNAGSFKIKGTAEAVFITVVGSGCGDSTAVYGGGIAVIAERHNPALPIVACTLNINIVERRVEVVNTQERRAGTRYFATFAVNGNTALFGWRISSIVNSVVIFASDSMAVQAERGCSAAG